MTYYSMETNHHHYHHHREETAEKSQITRVIKRRKMILTVEHYNIMKPEMRIRICHVDKPSAFTKNPAHHQAASRCLNPTNVRPAFD